MTEKKPGVILIDKLRAILLMEADFNFGNEMMFGSRAMHSAEVSEMFRHETHGGRKKMEAAEAGLARRLFPQTPCANRGEGVLQLPWMPKHVATEQCTQQPHCASNE